MIRRRSFFYQAKKRARISTYAKKSNQDAQKRLEKKNHKTWYAI